MSLISIFELNIFALVILLLILFKEHKLKSQGFANKIFIALVYNNLVLIAMESLSWFFDGKPGSINLILNWGFNSLLFCLAIVPELLWLLYADYQVFGDKNRIKKIKYVAMIIMGLNTLFVLINLSTGWSFYIDANNLYHRGAYIGIQLGVGYSILLYTSFFIFIKRKMIEKKYYKALLLFPLPQFIGSVLQVQFYGLSLSWPCMVISILIVYFNIQELGLNTDYLTGVYNRRLLDSCLSEKIRNTTNNKTFAAILIDLDKFKQINDNLGHLVGDQALQDVVKILRSCLRSDDLIARLGGDEFYIIMDISDKDKLIEVVERINKAAEEFNRTSPKSYEISFSMGYDIYDYNSKMGAENFMQHIDSLMYDQKSHKYNS